MNIFKINLLILILVVIKFQGYAQSKKNIIIPLKTGKNPSTQIDNIVIEPANLFIQSEPINTSMPYIQLELNIIDNQKEYSTFLWYYDVSNSSNSQKINYPKVYQNYAFNIEMTKEEVGLVVKKPDFKEALCIDLNQTAVIGNFSILFERVVGEWTVDIHGNQTDAFNTYTILLSEENEQKYMSFISLNKYSDEKLSLKWKDYDILILEESDKALYLKIFKNDSKKK